MMQRDPPGSPAPGPGDLPLDGLAPPVLPVPLLPARFAPPAVRAGIVARTAVIDRLLAANQAPVVTIVTPPGYGKTTVLTQWAARDRRSFAWLSVDDRGNDPVVLLSYLAVALAQVVPVDPTVFDALLAPHRPQRQAVLAGLAAAVAAAPRPFVLVLDDAHLLTDPEGLDAVRALLAHLPPGSQLAVAGRREPSMGLPRLRGEGRVFDLGVDDLRLDGAGARELLVAAGLEPLPEEELADLQARTEGWPIGLYFAALARRGGAAPPGEAAFAGDDRLLADYIRTEFLDQLPPDRLRFLTRTSVLDELSGPLCDEMLGRTGSAAELENIEASNLLLVPLDRQRHWYRYHHLFQALLRHELERTEPDAVPGLALRASRWCEAHDLFDAAVHYGQLAGDADRVSEILLRGGLRLLALGRLTALGTWLAWLSQHGDVDPGLAVIGAWVCINAGLPAEAERWADLAQTGDPIARQPDGSPLEGWVRTLRAVLTGDAEQMRRDAGRALELLAPASQWRGLAAGCLGAAEVLTGNFDIADRRLADAVEVGVHVGALNAVAAALAFRALIALRHDRWDDAGAFLDRSFSVIGTGRLHGYPGVALNHAVRARTAAHANDFGTARAAMSAAAGLLPTLTRALAPLAVPARLELARAAANLGDLPAAETYLADAQQLLADGLHFPVLQDDAQQLAAAIGQMRNTATGPARLTPAELRLLPLLSTQHSYAEIAAQLFVSVHTVKAQVTSIYRKLGVSSRTQAIDRGRTLGLLPSPTPVAPPWRPAPAEATDSNAGNRLAAEERTHGT